MKLTYNDEQIFIEADNTAELKGVKNWFNRYVENYMFSPLFKNKLWNGKRTRFNKESNSVPMGLWQEIYKCSNDFGFDINFTNKKDFPLNRNINKDKFEKFVIDFFDGYKYKGADFTARPYQVRVAYNILKNRYCNMSVATSGGKTFIYSLIFFYLLSEDPNRKFLLIVPSKTLVTQFYDDLQNFNWNGELDINPQEIYGKEEKPRTFDDTKEPNLYIGTFQSLVNAKLYPAKWFKQFYMVSVDECLHPDTLVTLDNNKHKKISDVNVGDIVKTINETTGNIEYKPVVKVHMNLSINEQMLEITLEDNTIIKITGNHKVQLTNKTWKRADELTEDDDILYIK